MKLFILVPCYNEEEVLPKSSAAFRDKLCRMIDAGTVDADSRIVFVDDGSKDRTWEIISGLHKNDPIFRGIKMSRNRGHQNALVCGLETVKDECDAVITIDAAITPVSAARIMSQSLFASRRITHSGSISDQ